MPRRVPGCEREVPYFCRNASRQPQCGTFCMGTVSGASAQLAFSEGGVPHGHRAASGHRSNRYSVGISRRRHHSCNPPKVRRLQASSFGLHGLNRSLLVAPRTSRRWTKLASSSSGGISRLCKSTSAGQAYASSTSPGKWLVDLFPGTSTIGSTPIDSFAVL